jgi:hypothetical protein
MDSWGYSLDTDEAVVSVKSSKVANVVGGKYVVIAGKNPSGDKNLLTIKEVVVSDIQVFQSPDAHTTPLRISCARLAGTITYGDPVFFYAYFLDELDNAGADRLQNAIDNQAKVPLTIQKIVDDFKGKRVGGGIDGATFDEDGDLIKPALKLLQKRRSGAAVN